MNRRTFVKTAAVTAVSLSASCQANQPIDIIDTHTHFYDPTRPEGVPWPGKKSPLYRKVMPVDFEKLTAPFGVTGTVVVEASSWLEDNQWVLDIAKDNKSIVGLVGNVDPTIENWERQIKRFSKDRLFRGVRLKSSINKLNDNSIIDKLKMMADLDLCIDLNGGIKAIEAAVVINEKVPNLRIVIEHLPGRQGLKMPASYVEALKKINDSSNLFVKISNVLTKVEGKTVTDPAYYTKALDILWNTFGEDRVIYGSNWPVSDVYNGEYKDVFNVVDTYFSAKGSPVREKYFSANALKAYKWVKR